MSGLLKNLPCDICGSKGDTTNIIFGDHPCIYCTIHTRIEADIFRFLTDFNPPAGMTKYSKELLEEGKKYYGTLVFKDGKMTVCDADGNPPGETL